MKEEVLLNYKNYFPFFGDRINGLDLLAEFGTTVFVVDNFNYDKNAVILKI